MANDTLNSSSGSADNTKNSGTWNIRQAAPGMDKLLEPPVSPVSRVNDKRLRRLYLQASSQQWFGPGRIHFDQPLEIEDEETRRVWIKLSQIFYSLEKVGLNVLASMNGRAIKKMKSTEAAYYLTQQASDEARHVFLLENYLNLLGEPPKFDRMMNVFEAASSFGFYKVENWLFSTLFSENFASVYLRHSRNANLDPVGSALHKNLMLDESRHLHFLHIVLPDIYDRMSMFSKTYITTSQKFIMRFTEFLSRSLENDAAHVGLDRRALLEEVFENVERSYQGLGVSNRWLPFPKIRAASPAH